MKVEASSISLATAVPTRFEPHSPIPRAKTSLAPNGAPVVPDDSFASFDHPGENQYGRGKRVYMFVIFI